MRSDHPSKLKSQFCCHQLRLPTLCSPLLVYLGNVLASISSSYAGLCKRRRHARFECGDHGVKSIAFNADGTHLAGSWKGRTALLLMTPAAAPIRCSSLSVSLLDRELPVVSVHESSRTGHSCVSSHTVSSVNPRCVSDRPRKHRRVCCHSKRRDFVFENCQICSSNSTHCGDGFLSGSIALMALCW